MARRISTSNGASPATEIRQPVGRGCQAGSMSVVQYHMAEKVKKRPARSHAIHLEPLGGDGASLDGAGGDLGPPGGHGHLAAGFQRVEGGGKRLGHQAQ